VHEVKFKVLNREVFDPLTGSLVPGSLRAAESTEAGWKDTVISYPGEVTRLATTLDIKGLYMWHCHIVEHEDNEMMVPYCIGNADPALGPVAPGCILNEPPVANDDAYETFEDTPLSEPAPGVLANDTDINENNVLTAVLVSGPANGTLVLNADGSFTYTPNGGYVGTDTFTYNANDGVVDSVTPATVTIKVNAKPPQVAQLYLTMEERFGILRGLGPNGSNLIYSDEDILFWNGTNYEMFFDGSAAGLSTSADIGAFDIDWSNNRILMAFTTAQTVPGVGRVTWNDIVAYDMGSHSFSILFVGADVGLFGPFEAIDALDLLPDGRLIVSTVGQVSVPSATGFPLLRATGQDLLAFTPTSLDPTTQGTWALYFDGRAVGLETDEEGVDAVSIEENGDVFLSTQGPFAVSGLSGEGEDVFVCTPTDVSTGAITGCTFSPYFDGTANGLSTDNVIGIDLP
jgi:VCBS repeat-containing protein